jgi:hypothetical protein
MNVYFGGSDLNWASVLVRRIRRSGEGLVARAASMIDLKTMFEEEPFNREKLASYTFKEFQAVKRQPWVDEWFSEE